jgi:exopolysaccharide production protein ExoZ
MMVVAFHIGGAFAAEKYFGEPLFAQLFRFGSAGVEFFFVLSGFIIYYVHHGDLNRPTAFGRFVVRRAERLYPTYWLIFAGVAGIALAFPAFREAVPSDPTVLFQSLLLIPQDPAVVGGTGAPLIIVAWSLHYEIVFYAVFAIFILSARLGLTILVVLAAWWLATAAGWTKQEVIFGFLKPHYFVVFAFGIASAWFAIRRGISRPHLWAVLGAVIFAVCAIYEVTEMFANNISRTPGRMESISLGYGAGSALIVAGLVGLEAKRQRAAPGLFVRLGDASYVLYLAHFPIISACAKFFIAMGSGLAWAAISFVITFIVCCVFSLLFWQLIERPMLNTLRRKRAASALPSSVEGR